MSASTKHRPSSQKQPPAPPAPPRNVTLLYPDRRRYSGNFSTHRFFGMGTAHLGLPLLGEILRLAGHQVRIYDEQITPFAPWMVKDADVVGISTQTSWAPQAFRLADEIRRMGKPVMMGGAHATLNPDECLDHADAVCRNEGERTVLELVEALSAKKSLARILGISYREHGKNVHNPERPFLGTDELSALPDPNWDLVQGWSSPLFHPFQKQIYYVQATRGCPAYCNFCSITEEFGRALRHRSVKSILGELHRNFDPETQMLFFVDDSIAGNRDFLRELLEGLLENKMVPKMGWHSQMRADVASDPSLVRLMRKTNCTFATFGFESINPDTLKSLQKGQTPEAIRRCIGRMHENKILVNGFFMLGSDHDTKESIGATVDFALKSGCVIAGFMPLTPFPGTGLFKEMESEGRIFIKDWELYDVQHVVYWPRKMSPSELYLGCLGAYEHFYRDFFRPSMLGQIRPQLINPMHAVVGGTWAINKRIAYRMELLANRDYLGLLKKLEKEQARGGHPVAEPFNTATRYHDAIAGRGRRRLWSEAMHQMGVVH